MSNNYGSIKTKLAELHYKRLLNNSKKTNINNFNLKKVKSIGILFDNKTSNLNTLIEDLSKEFKNTGVVSIYLMGYNIDEINKVDTSGLPTIYFTDGDVGWYGKPKFKDVLNFVNTPFDLLINLANSDIWTIKFCITMSKSKFKVGDYQNNIEMYDLMLDMKESNNMATYKNILIKYLRLINS
ncbi:MAG: hypothetical protein KAG96_00205 [Ichthyobacteriaceae bacterium]|nr:hypothetical protein [Ichthyobacteriaceae bacterium]